VTVKVQKSLQRPREGWENNIKVDFEETGREAVERFLFVEDRVINIQVT
jgi:hypothetical protein